MTRSHRGDAALPHYRLAGSTLMVWKSMDSYLADFLKRAGNNGSYSSWDLLEIVRAGADKVHLDVQINRFADDGGQLISFASLWVIAKLNGRWAALLRSSFALDEKIL